MAIALVLFDGNGALPQKATFQSPTDGDVLFVVTGTAWTQNAPTLIGAELMIDADSIGGALVYANNNASHQTLRTGFFPYSGLTIGEHTMTLVPSTPDTVTDTNDYYQVVMIY